MTSTFLVPKNNANSKLAAAITAVATSLSVLTGEGARFPSTYPFHITIGNEILKVTNRSTDTMTVTRAQEGTTAASHKAGTNVQLNITAKAISDLNTAVNDAEADIADLESDVSALQSAPPAHKASHQDGGADEISLAGLAGESVTPQPPKAHASSHLSGAGDAIKIDDLAAPDDNTDLDFSTARHGLCPKAPADTAKYLRGDATWDTPATGGVPSGIIAMWHGTLASIPVGWVLCDGNNGTPNLLSRFVVGVPNGSTNPGSTGGGSSKTTAGHQHSTPVYRGSGSSGFRGLSGTQTGWGYADVESNTWLPATVGNSGTGTSWFLTRSQTDSISDIRPSYYTVAYIMKT